VSRGAVASAWTGLDAPHACGFFETRSEDAILILWCVAGTPLYHCSVLWAVIGTSPHRFAALLHFQVPACMETAVHLSSRRHPEFVEVPLNDRTTGEGTHEIA
jgi:hypothetical protein